MFAICNACWDLVQNCSVYSCLTRFEKLNIWMCREQILEYLSKVSQTAFASDMFRAFLFGSHTKNWTDLDNKLFAQATFLHLFVELLES